MALLEIISRLHLASEDLNINNTIINIKDTLPHFL